MWGDIEFLKSLTVVPVPQPSDSPFELSSKEFLFGNCHPAENIKNNDIVPLEAIPDLESKMKTLTVPQVSAAASSASFSACALAFQEALTPEEQGFMAARVKAETGKKGKRHTVSSMGFMCVDRA